MIDSPYQTDFLATLSTPTPSPRRRLPTAPHQPGSDTSAAAAERIRPHLSALQTRILAYAKSREPIGFTRKDVERALDIPTPTACARLNELEHQPHHRAGLYKMTELVRGKDGAMTVHTMKANGCAIYRYRAERQ